jgi:uncharacterized protein YegL
MEGFAMKRQAINISLMIALLWALTASGFAIGILVPSDRQYAPLALVRQTVSVDIKENVARTKLQQVFYNRHDRQLEATYIFPVPKGANVTDFAMYINGKRVKGEVLERERAREIYEDIVRRMRDPGLLEYVDSQVLRVSVFPILPHSKQRIEVEFTHVLPNDNGLVYYEFPLHHEPQEQLAMEDLREWSFAISLNSRIPIKSIYSPTHKIEIKNQTDNKADIFLKPEDIVSDKDFSLYYTVSQKDLGLSLLTYRPVESDPGYFMLMLSPKHSVAPGEVNPKDVTFVLDTSGSMAKDNKLESAKEALLYCLSNLRPEDRFNIIRFSTEVEALSNEFLSATDKDAVKRGTQFVKELRPTGGTNINDALLRALRTPSSPERIHTIVFITDGKPTIGVTDVSNIMNNVEKENRARVRIFTFGVGFDVNTHLLDLVAQKTAAVAEYVKPEEEIETKVSTFFDKVGSPVLTDLALNFGKIDAVEVYPQTLPDLFAGSQIVLFGRYKTAGDTALTLTGSLKGKKQEFVYEETFPKESDENDFVEKLWAIRKVGFLLDEIRLHGENDEVREEVVRLAKKYGIVTPYTSYLVTEDEQRAQFASSRVRPPVWEDSARTQRAGQNIILGDTGRQALSYEGVAPAAGQPQRALESRASFDLKRATASKHLFDANAGQEAVLGAIALRQMKEAGSEESAIASLKTVRGKTFRFQDGFWVDQAIKGGEKETIRVKYLSEAYFALLRANPDLKDYFKLGDKIKVLINPPASGQGGIVLEISDSGKETLSPDELSKLRKS